ncbi:23S rRNA (cytidine(2498)-2'-O)-methyltransferase RlmM [Oleiagrimonas sp.]|uniref:23S rRNA (cytidine(2498)-2'-O)-methyltransferase RlmM n=1 Tax=Oleiagrimonas sp. TaxID=2010330 RepID=UPI0026077C7C|nr:23S rRNA (cytidine(2498)-2'-O)-methyltransferase RlmM [Oleiagrimonas sp.]MDA3914086.1 23S rRNA (cytidine(2498)-2'-O)-methyltransferase RlmM [Oleiagrimonas sp.]
MSDPAHHRLLAWCRPGFEGECAQELSKHDTLHGGGGYARAERGSGFVEFETLDESAAKRLMLTPGPRGMIFARQLLHVIGSVDDLPREDRLGVLMPFVEADERDWCDVWVESPDGDSGRELSALCRALNAALVTRMKSEKRLDRGSPWRLHVALLSPTRARVAVSNTAASGPWPGGIPRLRLPRAAPSRSTLKLEEAFLTLLDDTERGAWLQPGQTAVDLGAAPGGWTWQLVHRSIRVQAIDNGPMDPQLMASGLVEHLRVDGFRYRPPRPVDWLVCDMVEQPRRVAARMAEWLANGWCQQAVFNLKLPMKKRFDEVCLCMDLLRDACEGPLDLRARQLYHDREEITVFARRG